MEGSAKIAETIEKFRAKLGPRFRAETDQKILYIANLQVVLRQMVNDALRIYEKSLDDIISIGENQFAEFIDGVPSLDVETELVFRRNANWNKKVDRNDLADISALQTAIPYCDIVITENFWRDLIIRSGLGKKYNTVILSDINKLEEYL